MIPSLEHALLRQCREEAIEDKKESGSLKNVVRGLNN